jgi:uncharacterized protein
VEMLLLASAITFVAALAQTVTGFAFALILVPLLSLVYPPKLVVMVSLTLGLLTKPPLLLSCWRQVQLVRIAPMGAAAIVGAVLGTRLFVLADPTTLKLAIAVLVVALGVPLLLEYRRPFGNERLACLAAGFVSGLLTGSTSMGGPPVVLMGVNQLWEKHHLRANLIAYFTITSIASIALLTGAGVLQAEVLSLDATLLPAVALGFAAGLVAVGRVHPAAFRRGVILLILGSGILGAWTALASLLA